MVDIKEAKKFSTNRNPSIISFINDIENPKDVTHISLAAVTNIDFYYTNETTKNPVENLTTVIDNIRTNPLVISISCLIMRSDLDKFDVGFKERKTISFNFNNGKYNQFENYVIESLNVTQDVTKTNTVKVELKISEIKTFKFMKSKFIDIDGEKIDNLSEKNVGTGDISKGAAEELADQSDVYQAARRLYE